jgi:mRNA-degrading endonuclease toxin of MazEF toxin-antitoxin module
MIRGEVYWADVAPRSGSEERGRRPVVIVSHDGFNRAPSWRSLIVVPISTSKSQARRGLTAIALAPRAGGLRKACFALCHQVTTLDRGKVGARIGTLSRDSLARIDWGLRFALDLD